LGLFTTGRPLNFLKTAWRKRVKAIKLTKAGGRLALTGKGGTTRAPELGGEKGERGRPIFPKK